MKIVHINGYFKEDVVYQENLLTVGQHQLGNDVVLITSCYEPEMKVNRSNRKLPPGESIYNGVRVIRVVDFFELKKNALVILKGLYRVLKLEKPDIIFFHDVSPNLILGIIYKFFNKKVKFHIDFHSDEFNSRNSFIGPAYHFFWKIYFTLFKRKFDRFFCVAPESIHFVNKFYNIPLNNLILLPLPGDTTELSKKDLYRNELREKYNLSQKNILFIHTGKLPQEKETLLTLKAFTKCLNDNIRLIIAGSIEDEFQSIFNNYLKNDNRILFLGWQSPSQMRKLLCSCDVMLQPGSLSHIFVEAICCELPLILNNTPQGVNLTSFGNGLLINKKSEEDILKAMAEFIEEDKINKFRLNAKAAASHFDYLNIARLSLQ